MAKVLEIHHIDVNQGDATIITFRHDNTFKGCVVIDGGHTTLGGETVEWHLRSIGVPKVTHVICTHFDGDHAQGLVHLLGTDLCATALVYENGHKVSTGQLDENFRKAARLRNTKVEELSRAARILKPKMSKEERIYLDPDNPDKLSTPYLVCIYSDNIGHDTNQNSIACVLKYGSFKYFVGGDLESGQEDGLYPNHRGAQLILREERNKTNGEELTYKEALRRYEKRVRNNASSKTPLPLPAEAKNHICAFKTSHHGSNKSTSTDFLKELRPTAAFISAGHQNKFAHPEQDVISRLYGQPTLKAIFLTNCYYEREGVSSPFGANAETGKTGLMKAFVSGSTKYLGNVLLRVTEQDALNEKFQVLYYDGKIKQVEVTCGTEALKELPTVESERGNFMDDRKMFKEGAKIKYLASAMFKRKDPEGFKSFTGAPEELPASSWYSELVEKRQYSMDKRFKLTKTVGRKKGATASDASTSTSSASSLKRKYVDPEAEKIHQEREEELQMLLEDDEKQQRNHRRKTKSRGAVDMCVQCNKPIVYPVVRKAYWCTCSVQSLFHPRCVPPEPFPCQACSALIDPDS